MNQDKVLFYDDVILYEDGHGHGYVKLQVPALHYINIIIN